MLYFSEGGFTHSQVYNMPIYLRNFYFKKLLEIKKNEKEAANKVSKNSKINRPNINPRFKR